jgi:hypothetical protein
MRFFNDALLISQENGRQTRACFHFSFVQLFNTFEREYTGDMIKKRRPKERCRVLDKNATIVVSKTSFTTNAISRTPSFIYSLSG